MAPSPPQKLPRKLMQLLRKQNMLESAEEEDCGTAKALLEGGSDVNSSNERGERLLHWAAANSRSRLLRYLLYWGAELDAKCNNGNTALSIAARSGSVDVIDILVRSGAELNVINVEGKSPLHIAATKGHADAIRKLLELGANVHIRDNNGQTALYTAVCHDSISITKLLIDAEADVNATSNHGNSPLHIASQCNRVDIVKMLLERGAKVDIKNLDGYTPLAAAALEGHIRIVKILMEAGADIDLRDRNGRNTLHAVISIPIYLICHVVVCKELIFAGSDVLSRENSHAPVPTTSTAPSTYLTSEVSGRTPLQSAVSPAYQRRVSVPKMLIRKILLCDPRAVKPDTVNNDPALLRCWQTSKAVVQRMNNVKLANTSVTLRNFLLENDAIKLAGYMSLETQEELLKCAKAFRTYGEMIRYQLAKGNKRIKLTNAVNIVLDHSEAKDLPNEIRNKIYVYLTNANLRNVVRSALRNDM